ncbi:MAG: N-acetylmuramoyl-L-alanine amidase [Variovorax sp.]|nr:N-acetylmuramoyl-L-alanine amidase [Variovorax sp.]
MLYITKDGHVDAERIKIRIFSVIERTRMSAVNGIVVHQTGAPTAQATFNSYGDTRNGTPNGAHFLIDKDGTIYQTASLYRVTNHVGFVQSRCVITKQCTPTELRHAQSLELTKGNRARAIAVHRNEMNKSWPDRFPSNVDSIGIEIVGMAKAQVLPNGRADEIYEPVGAQQNASLEWLIKQLAETLNVSMQEVFRHPEIGRKNATEASTAKW